MRSVSISRKFGWLLVAAALLLVVRSLHAEGDSAKQASEPSTETPTPEQVSESEQGDSQAPAAAEIAPVTVPVSDAVKQAALLMRPSGATLDQVVSAMVYLNPAVFTHGDLQHVAFSRPLNVPSTQEILRQDPDGLALLLLTLDIVAAISPPLEIVESGSAPQVEVSQQQNAPSADILAQSRISASRAPAAEVSSPPVSAVLIGMSAALLLLSLMWIVFRLGKNRGCQPLPASGNMTSQEERGAPQAARDDQRMLQNRLPAAYLDYDDIEVLLQRVVAESPEAARQVLQLMHLFQLRRDREGFLQQHQKLAESGFYQRHEEAWKIIGQDAVELGLKLDAATAAAAFEKRIEQLEARVKMAEKARIAAEQSISGGEPAAGAAGLTPGEMQLQLDFGETDNHR